MQWIFKQNLTRPTLERQKTLGHIRSINPNMIIDYPRQSQSCQLVKIKMLNGSARNHRMTIPALPCGFFATHGKDFFFIFFNIQKEIVKNDA